MIRIGTLEDLDLLVTLSMKFISQLDYASHCSEERVRIFAESLLVAPNTEKIVIFSDDIGFVIGIASPFLFGNEKIATEMGWWVEPEHRKSNVGKELIDAFEYWAKSTGCSLITMMCLDEKVGTYYEKRGYKLTEFTYMKEV